MSAPLLKKITLLLGSLVLLAKAGPVRAQVVTEFGGGLTAASVQGRIALGADHAFWFTESVANKIGRITPAGTVTEFSTGISESAGLRGIAAGPDGNVWFTESLLHQIGRITPQGVVTEFSAGISDGASPSDIAAGPDGNLWFTELGLSRIGRITPDGVVTEFHEGITFGALPISITRGPDGNMWFTQGNNQIGRITRSGVITEFGAGISPSAVLVSIAAGPDGNLWFTEYGLAQIGRMSTSGTVVEFQEGISPDAGPFGIAGGPDGNMWFTERQGNRVGRITPDGVVTEFASGITPGARPLGIVGGEGIALWFTEITGNRIGKITTGGAPTIAGDFGIASIPLNGATSLTFTIGNPNSKTRLTHIAFTDELPTGLAVAPDGGLSGDCGGTVVATAGSRRINLTDGVLPAGMSCTFAVNVTGTAAGMWTNTTGNVTSLEGGKGGVASVRINVQPADTVITSANAAAFTVGVAGHFTVTATGIPIPAITVAGSLPSGVTFADNHDGTGTLSGKPAAGTAGFYPLTITAAAGMSPNATQAFTLAVDAQAGDAMQISIEPAHPTATDDIVVRSLMPPGGCHLLTSGFTLTPPNTFEALVFTTIEPDGCAADDTRPEARLHLQVGAPGTYHVVVQRLLGGDSPTPQTPETRATADVTVSDAEWLIPAVARANGLNGATWTSDLEIFNTHATVDANVVLTFLAAGGTVGEAPRATVVVPARTTLRIDDVLLSKFGLEQGSGALVVQSPVLELRFAASIGTASGGGRIAQNVPAVPGREKIRQGDIGILYGVREDDGARTNLVIANAGEAPAQVFVTLAVSGTSPFKSMPVTVPARGTTQINRVVRALGVEGPVTGARLAVAEIDAADGVAILATVIDNVTNAPRTLTPE